METSIGNAGKDVYSPVLALGTTHVAVHVEDVNPGCHRSMESKADGTIVIHTTAFLRGMGTKRYLGHRDAGPAGDLATIPMRLAEDGLPMVQIKIVVALQAASRKPDS